MGPVRELLRRATGDEHRALEADVAAMDRLSAEPERSRLAAGYRRLELANAAALAPFAAGLVAAGLSVPAGQQDRRPAGESSPLAPSSASEALGYLYVVCGSTLGGEVILRTLREQGCDTVDLAFLVEGPYAAPALWRSLLVVLERDLPADEDRTHALAGARKAFASARHHLCSAA